MKTAVGVFYSFYQEEKQFMQIISLNEIDLLSKEKNRALSFFIDNLAYSISIVNYNSLKKLRYFVQSDRERQKGNC